ncbi:hypothetical protein A2U01_0021329, partial [Trifolium medium]|nr:hypothetical protein [Trifolium medium]
MKWLNIKAHWLKVQTNDLIDLFVPMSQKPNRRCNVTSSSAIATWPCSLATVCLYANQFHVFNSLTPVQYYFNSRRWIYQTVEMFAADVAADKLAA